MHTPEFVHANAGRWPSCALAGWLAGGLAGWLVCRVYERSEKTRGLRGMSGGWLVGWLAGWLVVWLAGSLSLPYTNMCIFFIFAIQKHVNILYLCHAQTTRILVQEEDLLLDFGRTHAHTHTGPHTHTQTQTRIYVGATSVA